MEGEFWALLLRPLLLLLLLLLSFLILLLILLLLSLLEDCGKFMPEAEEENTVEKEVENMGGFHGSEGSEVSVCSGR